MVKGLLKSEISIVTDIIVLGEHSAAIRAVVSRNGFTVSTAHSDIFPIQELPLDGPETQAVNRALKRADLDLRDRYFGKD